LFLDGKFLLNGQKVGPEEMDSAEDPPVVIDGEEQGDEPAEDPAPYGKNYIKLSYNISFLLNHFFRL